MFTPASQFASKVPKKYNNTTIHLVGGGVDEAWDWTHLPKALLSILSVYDGPVSLYIMGCRDKHKAALTTQGGIISVPSLLVHVVVESKPPPSHLKFQVSIIPW